MSQSYTSLMKKLIWRSTNARRPRPPSAFGVACSFVRIPRLFVTLFLFPLLGSVLLAYGELLFTGLYLRAAQKPDTGMMAELIATNDRMKRVRQLLLMEEFTETRICDWGAQLVADGGSAEPGCRIQPFDVALRVDPALPKRAEATKHYVDMFRDAVPRIHLCANCAADITIDVRPSGVSTWVYDLWSIPIVVTVTKQHPEVTAQFLGLLQAVERVDTLLGDIGTVLPGFRAPIQFSTLGTTVALIMSVSVLLILALWLGLRAHRRVLEYFARSSVLLPLVAACGSRAFYGAIWWLTTFRVCAFLLAIVPAAVALYGEMITDDVLKEFAGAGGVELLLWLTTLILTLATAMIVSSIGELQQRHGTFSFLYRYLPMVLWGGASIVWVVTLLLPTNAMLLIRHTVSALPIAGLTPVLLAPALKPPLLVLVVHALLASMVIVVVSRRNARWFAAHLEEV